MENTSKSRYSLAFVLLFALSVFNIKGQTNFQKIYSTVYDKDAREVLPTDDGGFMIAGMSNNADITDCNVYVMKTDYAGEFVWGKEYGGPRPDYAYGMLKADDGNYFIVGYSASFSGGDMDVYLLKIDPAGNKIWEKTYIGFGNEEGREIIKTQDGNYVIVGSTNSNLSSQDAFLMKIDITGAVIWIKYYGGSNTEYGNSVKECSDGGFILTGQTFSYGDGGDTFIVRTNASGDAIWTKNIGATHAEEGVSVVVNNDNTFTFAVRDSSNGKDIDVRVIKTDGSGTVVWNKLYAGNLKDTPKKMVTTSDGGYMIGAISRSFGWIEPDMWLLKLNSSGDTTWTKHFGWSGHEHCHDLKQSADGGYIVVGHTKSNSPSRRIMFLKLNSNGVVTIDENLADNGDLNIYPNPCTEGKINVSAGGYHADAVKVYNALGELVLSERIEINNEPKIIDLKSNAPGVYFLSLESNNGIITRRIILQ